MKKKLLVAALAAMSLSATVFAAPHLPDCPDKPNESTPACRPTATTQLNASDEKSDFEKMPICCVNPDKSTPACQPTAETQIPSESIVKENDGMFPSCPDVVTPGMKACRPTATTKLPAGSVFREEHVIDVDNDYERHSISISYFDGEKGMTVSSGYGASVASAADDDE